jgi:O-antigen ligase
MPPAETTRTDRLALLVLQIGAVAVVLAAVPFKAFDLDRYFVPKELVLHVCAAVSALLLIVRRNGLTLTPTDLLLSAFLFASTLSALMATNLWLASRALAISLSGVALFWVTSTLRRDGLVRSLIVALAVGVVIGALTSLLQAYGVQTEYFSLNRAPGGTFGNRNFVAHLCAIGAPVVILSALTAKRGINGLLGGIGLAIVVAALVLSRSRAAYLAVIAFTAPVGLLAWMTRDRWHEPRTARRLAVLAVAAALGGTAAVVVPNRLEWKSDSPYLDSAAGLVNYREGSGRGRLVQYGNSLAMARAHPIFGVGPGNWPVVYPKYASRNDPSMSQEDGVTSNPWPSSDWVAFLAERGAIGFVLLLLAMFGLMWRAVRELWSSARDPERVITALALIATLIATAVVGAFDAVLLLAVPTFFVWTLAGALSPPVSGRTHVQRGVKRLVPVAVLALGILTVAHSAFQLAAMSVVHASTRTAMLETASFLDPGSYRIHMRLAQGYVNRGSCSSARGHARAARALMPNASEPRRYLVMCGGR